MEKVEENNAGDRGHRSISRWFVSNQKTKFWDENKLNK